MKKIFLLIAVASVGLFACNSGDKKTDTGNTDDKAVADSLGQEVMHGHNVAMAKMDNIDIMLNNAKSVLDSIAKLPAKAKEAALPYKAKLESLVADLTAARDGMEKWMNEYSLDSFKSDLSQRVNYLVNEKLKVNKMKDDILNGLQRADSVLKSKF